MTKLNLYVVRHGQTYFNIYNKLQGWSNAPLTEKGIQGAVTTGQKLAGIHFSAAYSSDTTRAQDTANIILKENNSAEGITLITSPFIREQFYGSFEGDDMDVVWEKVGAPYNMHTFKELVENFSLAKIRELMKAADPRHDAENNAEYWQRVEQGFTLIANNPVLHDNDNVLLISHGNTILSLLERYGDGKFDTRVRPDNGSITKMELTDGDLTIISYNQ